MREMDEKQGHLSHRQFTSFRCELRALEKIFHGKTVSELTPAVLAEFFRRGQASKKGYNNRRGLVGAFLKYCLLQDWIAANPIDKVPHFRGIGHRRGSAPTLTAEQCAEIMKWAEKEHQGALVPFVALCLFAGIRPDLYQGEISKLQPKHVRLDTGVILIEPEVSKVRMKRAVTNQPNLAAWLNAYPLDRYPIMPRGFRRLRLEFRKRFTLTHDILRHTFISMFVAKFRSMGDAALQAGNSESIIRKHYLDIKNTTEADEFFKIIPKSVAVASSEKKNDNALSACPHRVYRGLNASTPCVLHLTGKQGYGNTTNHHCQPKPANGYHRPASQRYFPNGQGTVDSHPARLDETPSHSPSPPRSLRLLRSCGGFASYPDKPESAGQRLTSLGYNHAAPVFIPRGVLFEKRTIRRFFTCRANVIGPGEITGRCQKSRPRHLAEAKRHGDCRSDECKYETLFRIYIQRALSHAGST